MTPIVKFRSDWGARPAKAINYLTKPAPDIFIHHSDSASGPEANMVSIMQGIQNYHMDTKGWNDIAYTWLVDREGVVWEGRGWGVVGAHTLNHNSTSHGICLIGNYMNELVTVNQINSVQWLIYVGRQYGIVGNGVIEGHRDVYQTDCPGDHGYEHMDSFRAPYRETNTVDYAFPPIHLADIVDVRPGADGAGFIQLGIDGGVYAWLGAQEYGTPVGKSYWGNRQAARFADLNENEKAAGKKYVIESTDGGRYAYPE